MKKKKIWRKTGFGFLHWKKKWWSWQAFSYETGVNLILKKSDLWCKKNSSFFMVHLDVTADQTTESCVYFILLIDKTLIIHMQPS